MRGKSHPLQNSKHHRLPTMKPHLIAVFDTLQNFFITREIDIFPSFELVSPSHPDEGLFQGNWSEPRVKVEQSFV